MEEDGGAGEFEDDSLGPPLKTPAIVKVTKKKIVKALIVEDSKTY